MTTLQQRDRAIYIIDTLVEDHAIDAEQVMNAKDRLKFASTEDERAAWKQKFEELKSALAESSEWLVKARQCMARDNIVEVINIGKRREIID